jgi:hypothetical protein
MGYILVAMLFLLVIVVPITVHKVTPNKRAMNENHQNMARLLDRIYSDQDVRPLLRATDRVAVQELVAEYYGEKSLPRGN